MQTECGFDTDLIGGNVSTQKFMDGLATHIEINTAFPEAECYCAVCKQFDYVGYEEENKNVAFGLKSGWCDMYKRAMQQCDFCSHATRKE